MKRVIIVSVGEFSMKTSHDIFGAVNNICKIYEVNKRQEDCGAFWGYKVEVLLQGEADNISSVIKYLRNNFKVKVLA